MNTVFALGNRASADEIRARLANPPSDSAVRVMLARLEKKGCLKHQQDGPRYIYSATISPAVAKRTALQQYLQTFFGGSMRQMMTALVAEAHGPTKNSTHSRMRSTEFARKGRISHDARHRWGDAGDQ